MAGKVVTILLIAVGLLNLYPVIGVLSAEHVAGLYGIDIESPDLETLMRHRAVMLGLLGGFMILSAFRPSLQLIAASIGLVSMLSFVVLAFISGEVGAEVNRVVVADVVGSIAIVFVLIINARQWRTAA